MEMTRRTFCLLTTSATVGTAAAALVPRLAAQKSKTDAPVKDVTIVEFTNAGEKVRTSTVPKIVKTDAEWRAQLSPASYDVTRHEGTERPGSGALLNEHGKGVFR